MSWTAWEDWQKDILREMRGCTNREIGERVGRSIQSVRNQRERMGLIGTVSLGWSAETVVWARANRETDPQAAYICAMLDRPDGVAAGQREAA